MPSSSADKLQTCQVAWAALSESQTPVSKQCHTAFVELSALLKLTQTDDFAAWFVAYADRCSQCAVLYLSPIKLPATLSPHTSYTSYPTAVTEAE